jgi:hypothetical protein
MAFRAGTTTKLYLGNAAGALQDLSAYADNLSGPQTTQMLKVTAFGQSDEVYIPGIAGGDKISFSGPLDATLHTQLQALRAAGSAAAFVIGWGGSVATYPRSAGSIFVDGITYNSTTGGRLEYNASCQITGAVTNGVF